MEIDLEKAFHFIEEYGTNFQKSYARCLFGANNLPETLRYLSEYQNEDGGWTRIDPDYMGDASSITCTMSGFAKYERLNITDCSGISESIGFLKQKQKRTGLWDEPAKILDYTIPPWYYPRVIKNQIWFTNGMLRYVISRKPEEKEMITSARIYLRKHWNGKCFPGYEHNNWMGIVSFYKTGLKSDDEIYQGCLMNLRKNMRSYDMADIAWTLESCVFLKLLKQEAVVQTAIEILLSSQDEDGGFGTSYGQSQRVDVTIEAIDSLASYGELPRTFDFQNHVNQV